MTDGTRGYRVFVKLIVCVAAVILLSMFVSGLWQQGPEGKRKAALLVYRDGMTIAEFGRENGLPNALLRKALRLQGQEDLEKKLDQLGLSHPEISERIDRSRALETEFESKNWLKIPVKFLSWFLFLGFVFYWMRRRRITPPLRRAFYLGAVLIFGALLGADPGPMGTVKDAIVLYGAKGVVFPPRLVAMTVFLLLVVLANKFICSWGCQAGTLQDLIFRFNRDRRDTRGLLSQYRPPFVWTNAIRVTFLLVFTVVAFAWATDLIEFVDPFKIYKPAAIGIAGGISLGIILVAALFVYRPWCQFLCPFGLVGWFLERYSLFKIQVNYKTCIGCRSCEKACPSTVMGAILKQDRVIPDCFACGTCIEVCPTGSIRLASGKRDQPPAGKFPRESPVQSDTA